MTNLAITVSVWWIELPQRIVNEALTNLAITVSIWWIGFTVSSDFSHKTIWVHLNSYHNHIFFKKPWNRRVAWKTKNMQHWREWPKRRREEPSEEIKWSFQERCIVKNEGAELIKLQEKPCGECAVKTQEVCKVLF